MSITGKRILIFGDSLSHRGHDTDPPVAEVTEDSDRNGPPGDLFASHLLEMGANKVRINAKVGRSAYNFFRVEDADDLLKDDINWKPDIVFIFLGTNDLGLSMIKDAEAMERIRSVFAKANAEVWSIGPPSFAKESRMADTKEVVEMLERVFGVNRVIDARPLTSDLISSTYRTGDGVHFKSAGSKLFASRLARAVEDTFNPKTDPKKTESTSLVPRSPFAIQTPWQSFGAGIGLGLAAILAGFGLYWIIKRRELNRE